MSTFSTSAIQLQRTLDTTNATPQNFGYIVANDGGTTYFEMKVTARRLSDGATKIWAVSGGYKKNSGSNAVAWSQALLGSQGDTLALLGTDVSVTVSGANVQFNAIGLASTNIAWYLDVSGYETIVS